MPADLDEHVLAVLTGATLPELFARAVAERGAAPYASFDGSVLTFDGLAAAVADAQRGLSVLGVQPGDRVAVMLPNHLEHVVLVHAIVGMGAIWVPVNPRLRGHPLAHQLADSDPSPGPRRLGSGGHPAEVGRAKDRGGVRRRWDGAVARPG